MSNWTLYAEALVWVILLSWGLHFYFLPFQRKNEDLVFVISQLIRLMVQATLIVCLLANPRWTLGWATGPEARRVAVGMLVLGIASAVLTAFCRPPKGASE